MQDSNRELRRKRINTSSRGLWAVRSRRLDGFAENLELHFPAFRLAQEEAVFFDAAVHVFARGKSRLLRVIGGLVNGRADLYLVDNFALNRAFGEILARIKGQHSAVLIGMSSGERGRRGNYSE